jgi:hypothetical protein
VFLAAVAIAAALVAALRGRAKLSHDPSVNVE